MNRIDYMLTRMPVFEAMTTEQLVERYDKINFLGYGAVLNPYLNADMECIETVLGCREQADCSSGCSGCSKKCK